MSWIPLSKTQHSEKALVKNKNFKFVEHKIVTDIFNFEFEAAISCVPIFFAQGPKGIRTVCLMGLERDKNLFVQPGGMWLLPHFIPATIASFPFGWLNTEDKKNIVVLKEDSDWIVDRVEGIPFFDEKGNETATLKHYLGLISKIIEAEKLALEVGLLLKKLELLEPFNWKTSKADGTEEETSGLLKIKLSVFRDLDDDKFLELRKSSALDFIYAHLYSMSSGRSLRMLSHKKHLTEKGLMELGSQIFDETENELDFNL